MGSGIVEAGLFRSERYELEQRTSDPATHFEGEAWIRTDIAPATNQIATLRFDNGSGTIDIPIFDVAASSPSEITEAWRVRVNGVTGFIPAIQNGGAYDQLRLQHNGSWWGFHDSLSAIPDSENLHHHYDALDLSLNDGDSVSSWPDAKASADLTGNDPTYKTSIINGNPIVRFDGSNNYLESGFTTLSQPTYIVVVFKEQSTSTGYVYDGATVDEQRLLQRSSDWAWYAGNTNVAGGSSDTNPHIQTAYFDGSNSHFRIDGTQVASGSAGTNSLTGLTLAERGDLGGQKDDVDVGEVFIYQRSSSSSFESDIESYLSDKWGIAV